MTGVQTCALPISEAGGEVRAAAIGDLPWVEVDNHDDLVRAREIACRY